MSQSRLCIIPSDAVSDKRLTHVQLRVLLAIGSYTGKDRAAFPKQQTVADMLGLARETVNRALAALKRFGYIEIEHQRRSDGGQRENLYWVKLDPIEQAPCDELVTPPVTLFNHTPRDAIGSHPRTIHKNDKTIAKAIVAPQPPDPSESKSTGRVRSAARGNRIAPNWAPTITDYAFASSAGMTREDINREADKFRDYWIAKSGREACKLDWSATWRNWVRSDFRKRNGSGSGNASRNGSRTEAFDRLAERLQGGSDRADAWQHDDPATEGGYVIDVSPTRITG
jgi:DNA-binding transcriptional MocR family regulator